MGFGTGLNTILTALDALKFCIPVEYTSIESIPLSNDIITLLNYEGFIHDTSEGNLINEIHHAEWENFESVHAFFKLRKIQTTIQDFNPESDRFNLVYFDAFAPNKQPEVWQKRILKKVFDLLTEKSAFVTYCAQGQVKRDLKDIGCTLHTIPGPPGKKEMIRGIKH